MPSRIQSASGLTALLLAATALAQQPQILGPYMSAGNFATNIVGTADNRPETWGKAGAVTNKLTFSPPAGYRVRILRVTGDLVGWPQPKPASGCSGVLWGLQTTAPGVIAPGVGNRSDYAADNTMVYVQDATCGEKFRTPIDSNVSAGGLLMPDNVLVSVVATWLNDTGAMIHLEATFTLTYQFELAQ